MFRIITLFPEFFKSPLESGLLGKAVDSGIIKLQIIDLKDYSGGRFKRCDDYPYGGGSGMVLKPAPLVRAIAANVNKGGFVLCPAPGGRILDQGIVKELSIKEDITIICGNYEGIDQRIIDRYVDLEISVGDYVLSGGEFAALLIVDTCSRYVPGFMSNAESLREESFENSLLEYPQYTRPSVIDELKVPEVLLSGNHKKIREWRLKKSIEKTKLIRPDLYERYIKTNRSDEG